MVFEGASLLGYFRNLDWRIVTNAAKGFIALIFRIKESSP
jgi:hypothetical protein